MKVLLFGASGFIGRHVVEALRSDARVSAVECPGRDRYDLVHDGVADLTRLVAEVRPDAVVCCAGRLTGSGYELLQANTMVVAKLADAVSAWCPGIRLVRLGSAAEYGPVPFEHAVSESDQTRPVSEYGVSHLAGTRLLELASAARRVDGVTLRVFNPIGPGLHEENLLGRAAAAIRTAIRTRAHRIVMGRLGAYRDFVDVRDLADAVRAATLAPALRARVFNVGSGRAVTARTAVELLARVAGFAGEIRETRRGSGRSTAVGWIRADLTRTSSVLGWAPVHELEDSLKEVWAGGPVFNGKDQQQQWQRR
jgi:nucleoside-diphosphate-sugar epimerase